MAVVAIIPARLGSTRLPNKPLLKETGKYLIQHVVEQVRRARGLDRVVVATDDKRIVAACDGFQVEAFMTRPDHPTGTDRIAEVARRLGLTDEDIVVNVQGDEPEIPPACLTDLVNLLANGAPNIPMATLAAPLPADLVDDPSKVKVVFDLNGRAMYFSRAPIPFDRDGAGQAVHYLHVGVYAYRAGFLQRFAALPQTPSEQAEKLEQLRVLDHGWPISVGVVAEHATGIDTPEDYAEFVARQPGRSN